MQKLYYVKSNDICLYPSVSAAGDNKKFAKNNWAKQLRSFVRSLTVKSFSKMVSALALLNLLVLLVTTSAVTAKTHRCFQTCWCTAERAECDGLPNFQSSSRYQLSQYRNFTYRNTTVFRSTLNFTSLSWQLWNANQHYANHFHFMLTCRPADLPALSHLFWMNRNMLSFSCIAAPHIPKPRPALIITPNCDQKALYSVIAVQATIILVMSTALAVQCRRLTDQYRRRLRLFDRMRLVEEEEGLEDLEDNADGFEGDDLPLSVDYDLPDNLCLQPPPPYIRMTPADIDSDDADDDNITTGSRISVACPDRCGLNIVFQRHLVEQWHKDDDSGNCAVCWAFNEHKHMRIWRLH